MTYLPDFFSPLFSKPDVPEPNSKFTQLPHATDGRILCVINMRNVYTGDAYFVGALTKLYHLSVDVLVFAFFCSLPRYASTHQMVVRKRQKEQLPWCDWFLLSRLC